MDVDFWLERWDRGETVFHQQHINPYLAYYYGVMGPSPEKRAELRVFVPLCGKSRDLWWLRQNGYDTVGVECSALAVEQFFGEHQLAFDRTDRGGYVSYRSEGLEILLADFFSLQAEDIGEITDIYDRASLIALPDAMRTEYVSRITALQQPGTRTLLITLTYPQAQMEGPPFSVSDEEVERLYGGSHAIARLAAKNVLEDEPRFRDRGLTSLTETAYKLTKNQPT